MNKKISTTLVILCSILVSSIAQQFHLDFESTASLDRVKERLILKQDNIKKADKTFHFFENNYKIRALDDVIYLKDIKNEPFHISYWFTIGEQVRDFSSIPLMAHLYQTSSKKYAYLNIDPSTNELFLECEKERSLIGKLAKHQWYFLSYYFDGRRFKIFIGNGLETMTAKVRLNEALSADTTQQVYIGQNVPHSHFLTGAIDELSFKTIAGKYYTSEHREHYTNYQLEISRANMMAKKASQKATEEIEDIKEQVLRSRVADIQLEFWDYDEIDRDSLRLKVENGGKLKAGNSRAKQAMNIVLKEKKRSKYLNLSLVPNDTTYLICQVKGMGIKDKGNTVALKIKGIGSDGNEARVTKWFLKSGQSAIIPFYYDKEWSKPEEENTSATDTQKQGTSVANCAVRPQKLEYKASESQKVSLFLENHRQRAFQNKEQKIAIFLNETQLVKTINLKDYSQIIPLTLPYQRNEIHLVPLGEPEKWYPKLKILKADGEPVLVDGGEKEIELKMNPRQCLVFDLDFIGTLDKETLLAADDYHLEIRDKFTNTVDSAIVIVDKDTVFINKVKGVWQRLGKADQYLNHSEHHEIKVLPLNLGKDQKANGSIERGNTWELRVVSKKDKQLTLAKYEINVNIYGETQRRVRSFTLVTKPLR